MFLNVYKAPYDPTTVRPLLNWTPPSRSVAIGDLNSVYWAWQPGANRYYGQGDEIKKWAEEHNLTCLIVGEPTHRAGIILDLAWSNVKGAMVWVGTEECMTSDPKEKILTRSNLSEKLRIAKANIPQFTRIVTQ